MLVNNNSVLWQNPCLLFKKKKSQNAVTDESVWNLTLCARPEWYLALAAPSAGGVSQHCTPHICSQLIHVTKSLWCKLKREGMKYVSLFFGRNLLFVVKRWLAGNEVTLWKWLLYLKRQLVLLSQSWYSLNSAKVMNFGKCLSPQSQ